MGRDDLRDRAAAVVADQRGLVEPDGVHEVDDELRRSERAEVGVRLERELVAAERPVRDDAAEVLRERRRDLAPEAAVDDDAVHEEQRLAGSVLAVADRSLRQMNLSHAPLLARLHIQAVRI
jgi:hypothetical protein